jgi:hypothetical protein
MMEQEEYDKRIKEQEEKLAQMEELTRKIKHCLDIGTMSFFLEDGKLVALGHFPAGDDTIGHDNHSMISWEMFLEQDF